MITAETVKALALSFDEVTEKPHFEKTSFRVKNKIFATLDAEHQKAALKLSEIDQSVFCVIDRAIMYPANGAWGKQGWTIVHLDTIDEEIFKDALVLAYCAVAPKSLAEKYLPNGPFLA